MLEPSLSEYPRIVEVLKDKYCIVSGLAKGIDGQAHHCAKDTIGFIGCGIDQIYPKCNADLYHTMAKEQLIMSEYDGNGAFGASLSMAQSSDCR